MNIATIEVASTAPPPEGKKKGTIRTAGGETLYCWPDKLGLFRPGQAYAVEYDESQFKGRTYKTITRVKPAPNAMAPIEQERASRPAPSIDKTTNQEIEFVTRMLCSMVQGGRVHSRKTSWRKQRRCCGALTGGYLDECCTRSAFRANKHNPH
jgi:hypothetical protein